MATAVRTSPFRITASPFGGTDFRASLADGGSAVMILPNTACGVLQVYGGFPTSIS